MSRDIFSYTSSCKSFQLNKHSTELTAGNLQSIQAVRPFQILAIDFTGPFPTSRKGDKFVLVCIDMFTKSVEAIALPNSESHTTVKAINDNVIIKHGIPEIILSDNGRAFIADPIKRYCEGFNIKHSFSSPYHPETNGLVERFNRTLKSIIRSYINSKQTNWDENLSSIIFAYVSSTQSTTKISPFELVYERKPRLPGEHYHN
ncbi:Retrovirus-related Pol polyprotein from transposon [Smittium culicis]|uniref:Retrovirus-related Pol polyprotein from transposon n=1 Tax=Smittium culicis TaxID=133412 RepID=A0A1R1XKF1_9FUNG|nr:Retrovirus-related Pol polyprotein from transposon [Smittium culicis]